MAPSVRPGSSDVCAEDDETCGVQRADRKIRKPLVEKKRRARINESLQELRTLLADADFNSKMENAEVLEMTVKKVEDVLKSRSQEKDSLNREASERFAAGYIQCMHEVHMFMSSCPGIDAAVAAELLNHLLECMPLNEDHLQDVLMDLITDSNSSTWTGGGEALSATLASPGGSSLSSCEVSALSPATSAPSSEDSCSDLDEVDSEHHHSSTEVAGALSTPAMAFPHFMWRPW
ncbi:Transcription cofactor HES-6 [Oryzias melastigma]|uniref:Transcription cofactor HES-6 n=1 Tax=Oryzias melastigma TaxID=30732 RepID=A0A834BWN7_ORYME|nr:Transcription cofactor HES-6 [Oryzias melastigma]